MTEIDHREEIRQDLEKSVEILDEHGWCQGLTANDDGRVCAQGAVWAAVIGHDRLVDYVSNPSPEEQARWRRSIRALENQIPEKYRLKYPGGGSAPHVPHFNDASGMTVDGVKDLFRRAIKDQIQ